MNNGLFAIVLSVFSGMASFALLNSYRGTLNGPRFYTSELEIKIWMTPSFGSLAIRSGYTLISLLGLACLVGALTNFGWLVFLQMLLGGVVIAPIFLAITNQILSRIISDDPRTANALLGLIHLPIFNVLSAIIIFNPHAPHWNLLPFAIGGPIAFTYAVISKVRQFNNSTKAVNHNKSESTQKLIKNDKNTNENEGGSQLTPELSKLMVDNKWEIPPSHDAISSFHNDFFQLIGIKPVLVQFDEKIGPEVVLFLRPDNLADFGDNHRINMKLESGIASTSFGDIFWNHYIFYRPDSTIKSTFEICVNPFESTFMMPLKALSLQMYWNVIVHDENGTIINWLEFENDFGLAEIIHQAECDSLNDPGEDFFDAKREYISKYHIK